MENEIRENAIEIWPLYDSVMIMNEVNSLYPTANWYQQYSDFAAPAEIPFFNVRNKSVGEAYCNFDSSDKLSFPYQIHGMGIYISAPVVSGPKIGATTPDAANQTRCADIFFATEIIRHSAFILKVGQDEKLNGPIELLPSGEGVSGWAAMIDAAGNALGQGISSLANGAPNKKNIFMFPNPIDVPRDRNLSGLIVLSPYLRDALTKCDGPGSLLLTPEENYPDKYPAASLIRITLIGKRGVQTRNKLHK